MAPIRAPPVLWLWPPLPGAAQESMVPVRVPPVFWLWSWLLGRSSEPLRSRWAPVRMPSSLSCGLGSSAAPWSRSGAVRLRSGLHQCSDIGLCSSEPLGSPLAPVRVLPVFWLWPRLLSRSGAIGPSQHSSESWLWPWLLGRSLEPLRVPQCASCSIGSSAAPWEPLRS